MEFKWIQHSSISSTLHNSSSLCLTKYQMASHLYNIKMGKFPRKAQAQWHKMLLPWTPTPFTSIAMPKISGDALKWLTSLASDYNDWFNGVVKLLSLLKIVAQKINIFWTMKVLKGCLIKTTSREERVLPKTNTNLSMVKLFQPINKVAKACFNRIIKFNDKLRWLSKKNSSDR